MERMCRRKPERFVCHHNIMFYQFDLATRAYGQRDVAPLHFPPAAYPSPVAIPSNHHFYPYHRYYWPGGRGYNIITVAAAV